MKRLRTYLSNDPQKRVARKVECKCLVGARFSHDNQTGASYDLLDNWEQEYWSRKMQIQIQEDKTHYKCPKCDANLYTAEYGDSRSDESELGLICEEDDCTFEVEPDDVQELNEPEE